jgi:hypothetical protein
VSASASTHRPSVPSSYFPFLTSLSISLSFDRHPHHDFNIGESSSPFVVIVGYRDRAYARRLHTRAHARRPRISSERAWQVCQYPPRSDCGAACAGSVPQAAHPRADTASLGCAHTRYNRKVVSDPGMGPDALWRNRVPRVLS